MIRICLDKEPKVHIEKDGTKLEADMEGVRANVKKEGIEVEADLKWKDISNFFKETGRKLDEVVWSED